MSYNSNEDRELEKIVKFEAVHQFTLFPKKPNILGKGDFTWGITKWGVMKVLEGELIETKDDNIIVCGVFESEINKNSTYTILAKETENEKHGKQYELIYKFETLDLKGLNNQKSFLRTFLTEGQIDEMYKVIENPLVTIDSHDKETLKKVKGIGNYVVERIIERYERGKDYCKVYIELHNLGLTPKFVQRLIARYKDAQKIIDIIKNNPYQLSFDVDGIGFKTADAIALKNGMSLKSPKRIAGFINYYLNVIGEQSNSYVYANNLTAIIFESFGGKDEIFEEYKDDENNTIGNNVKEAIDGLVKQGILVVSENENKSKRKVYLKRYYELELEIAQHLKRISLAKNNFVFGDWRETVKHEETKQGWAFTDEQLEGIEMTLKHQVSLISGGAGVGKTSVLTGVLNALGAMEDKYSFCQCALAGKAGARMQEVTGKEGSTIHRLLGFNPQEFGGFDCNEENPLDYDIIVLDEISLVGGEIFLSLLKAIPTGSKLIILGDLSQLESIGSLNLAKDLFDSDFITTCNLTKIHRQAEKSGIIVSSLNIREQKTFFKKSEIGIKVVGELQDMIFDLNKESDDIAEKAFGHFKKYWGTPLVDKNIMAIQILCPVKERGDSSVYEMNNLVQQFLNPQRGLQHKEELVIELSSKKTFILREGDKVLNLKNNYQLKNLEDEPTQIFNGWTGIIRSINKYDELIEVYFPIIKQGIIVPFKVAKNSLTLGYASTVHKYQGSSAKVIIGILDYSTPPNMRTKELVYTLLTRAEELCVLICQTSALNSAIETSGVSDKNTFLLDMLEDDTIEPKVIEARSSYTYDTDNDW